jgi:glycerophosphoryl diester phosphodiesterase
VDLPLLLGHRGAPDASSVPENTIASFDLALEHGCDGFEFDVRLTADNKMVVCHDAQVGPLHIETSNYHELLQLPSLEEILEHYANRCFLNIELKVADIETRFLSAVREYQLQSNCVVSSFLPEVILELKVRSGRPDAGIICENLSQLSAWNELPVEYVMVHESLVDQTLINEVHGASRKIFVWTVNSAPAMVRMAELGVDGILSDDTRLLVQTLRPSSFVAHPTNCV